MALATRLGLRKPPRWDGHHGADEGDRPGADPVDAVDEALGALRAGLEL
ncbi:hypothetical protein [Nocardiopsis sp. NRRL B-16309]|nr:hypothetical protein [Nocardiopsis sp. NRRL B-16309]